MQLKIALICALLQLGVDAQGASPKPSVIFVLVDDLGSSDVSFNARRLNNASAAFETPNIDKLSRENGGIQLTNYWTHTLCGPSRSAFMTGRLSHHLGNPFAMVKGGGLDPKYGTIAQEFKLRGYSTHIVGKWGIDVPRPSEDILKTPPSYHHFNGVQKGLGPTERGFDEFYGLYLSGHNHYTKEVLYDGAVDWHRHNATHMLDYPDVDPEPHVYSTHIFTREAKQVIRKWTVDKPGFLHLAYTAPHDPLQAPEKYINDPDCARMSNWRRRTFCGMVKCLDEAVGEIVQTLREQKLQDNTIIVFSTDNGGAPSVGGFNYPFKGEKSTVFNGGVRGPGLINVPPALRAVQRGSQHNQVTHIADLGVTLLGLVDRISGNTERLGKYESLGSDLDAVDHSEALFSKIGDKTFPEASMPVRKSTVLEFNAFQQHAAYLQGDWKLILGNAGRDYLFREPTGALFDEDRRFRFTVEEIVCDFIDRGLGANWFIYGWVFRFFIDRVFASGSGDESAGKMFEYVTTKQFGDTIEITEENLPVVAWDKYALGKVQLYNLRDDPYERKNVALENQDLVVAMAQTLREKVRNDDGHNLSVQKQFALFTLSMVDSIKKAAVVTIMALAATGYLISKHLKRLHFQLKSKKQI